MRESKYKIEPLIRAQWISFMGFGSISESNNPLILKELGKNALSLNRSRFQISIELLMAISHGVHKSTNLAFECKIPWNSVKKMLALLLSKDLVYEVSKGRRGKYYYVTSKGKNTVRYYTGLLGLVEV